MPYSVDIIMSVAETSFAQFDKTFEGSGKNLVFWRVECIRSKVFTACSGRSQVVEVFAC